MAKITSKVSIGDVEGTFAQIPKITAPSVTVPEYIKGLSKGLGNVSVKEEIANFISENQNINPAASAIPAGLLVDQVAFAKNLPVGPIVSGIQTARMPLAGVDSALGNGTVSGFNANKFTNFGDKI